MQLCSKTWGTRNRTRDLQKKGSAFIMSSTHWIKRRVVVDAAFSSWAMDYPTISVLG